MSPEIISLLTEIRDNLAALRAQTAEEKKEPCVVTKKRAMKIAGVSKSTLERWVKSYSGIKCGTNQYNLNKLKQILNAKGRA